MIYWGDETSYWLGCKAGEAKIDDMIGYGTLLGDRVYDLTS